MNSRLAVLVKGELSRLNKYNVFSISILVTLIWGVILFLVNEELLGELLPMILLLDSTMMSMMYIGSVMHFEKNESTISSMLITPTTNSELVASKVIANVIHNLVNSILLITVFAIFKGSSFHWSIPLLLLGVILSTSFFTIAGLVMGYYQKDFTGMLVNIMIFGFGFLIPTILFQFSIITGPVWENILLLNPVQAASEIIAGSTDGYEFGYKFIVGIVYMGIGSIVVYLFLAIPKFQNYAIRQSGV